MTTETQIEVAFVNPPKDGQFSGNIKTKDGNTYGVSAKDLAQFKQGCSYVIEYEERAGGGKWAGRTFRDIKSAKLVSNAPAANSNGSVAGNSGHGGGGTNNFRNPEQMFVEALLTKALDLSDANGHPCIPFNEEAVTKAAFMLQTVWQRLWGDNNG